MKNRGALSEDELFHIAEKVSEAGSIEAISDMTLDDFDPEIMGNVFNCLQTGNPKKRCSKTLPQSLNVQRVLFLNHGAGILLTS